MNVEIYLTVFSYVLNEVHCYLWLILLVNHCDELDISRVIG